MARAKTAPEVKTRGLSKMTKEKHGFSGYAVRKQKNSYFALKYISASLRGFPDKTTEEQAWAAARVEAQEAYEKVLSIFFAKKSWEGRVLTPEAIKRLERSKFRVVHVTHA